MSLDYQMIGKRIRRTRKKQRITQQMLAEQIGKSVTYVSLLENGDKGLRLETLVSISNALGVTTDSLLMDNLKQQDESMSAEYEELLSDCTDYERRVIMESARELKRVLKENVYLKREEG